MSKYTLTVGEATDGRTLAIITSGGHPQISDSGDTSVLSLEVVTGWTNKQIKTWFRQQLSTKPWKVRH